MLLEDAAVPDLPDPVVDTLRRRVTELRWPTGRGPVPGWALLPGGAPDDGPFRCTPQRCQRAIGVQAVAAVRHGQAAGVPAAVAAVLAEVDRRAAEDQPLPWWGGWWARLDLGARSVVQARAVAWATRLVVGLDWSVLDGRPMVVDHRPSWRSRTAGGRIELRARVDVLVLPGRGDRRSAPRVAPTTNGAAPQGWVPEDPLPSGSSPTRRTAAAALVVGTGVAPAHCDAWLAYPALVTALAGQAASCPGRVVGWWPDSGQLRVVDVDRRALERSVDAVVALAPAPSGSEARARSTDRVGRRSRPAERSG
jgi:hypothetical protein